MNLQDICTHVGGQLIGEGELDIQLIQPLQFSEPGALTFVFDAKQKALALTSPAAAFITYDNIEGLSNQIVVKEPRVAMAQVTTLFSPSTSIDTHFIAPSSIVSENAQLNSPVHVSDRAVIGDETQIGAGTSIGIGVVIGKGCQLGQNCLIHPNVTILDGVILGNNVIVQPGTVIGSDGFGYLPQKGTWKKIDHIGSVVIEDDVEIGANCTIDKGCLGNTMIGKGTKIDNLVHIAHNVIIEENCAIAAQVGCLGRAHIKKGSQIGGQTGIADVTVGENCIVAARSGVSKSLKDNSFASGFPAWDHQLELKKEAMIRKQAKSKSSGSTS